MYTHRHNTAMDFETVTKLCMEDHRSDLDFLDYDKDCINNAVFIF